MDKSVTYRYREFLVPGIFHFFGGIGTGIGTNWYRKKILEPVSGKFGTEKKSPDQKSTGIGIKIFGTGKKVLASFNILGTYTHWLNRPPSGFQCTLG